MFKVDNGKKLLCSLFNCSPNGLSFTYNWNLHSITSTTYNLDPENLIPTLILTLKLLYLPPTSTLLEKLCSNLLLS